MNKIFKVIWCESTQTWQAVSELSKNTPVSSTSNVPKANLLTRWFKNVALLLPLSFFIQDANAAVAFSSTYVASDGNTYIYGGNANAAQAQGADQTWPYDYHNPGSKSYNNPNVKSNKADSYADEGVIAEGIAIGNNTNAVNSAGSSNGIAIGDYAQAGGGLATAIGAFSRAENLGATAIGTAARAQGFNALSIMRQSAAIGDYSAAIGSVAYAKGNASFAFGASATANGDQSIAIGNAAPRTLDGVQGQGEAKRTKYDGINNTQSNGIRSVAIGSKAKTNGDDSFAFGSNSTTGTFNEVPDAYLEENVLSADTNKKADRAIAFGTNSAAKGTSSVAFGYDALAGQNNAIAFGIESKARKTDAIAFGSSAQANESNSIAFGSNAHAEHENVITIGKDSSATKSGSMAIGENAHSNANNSLSLGKNTVVNPEDIGTHYSKYTNEPFNKENGVVSIANKGKERRIINVAAGSNDTDVVNVKQLTDVNDNLAHTIAGNGYIGYTIDKVKGYQYKAPDFEIKNETLHTVKDAVEKAQTNYVSVKADLSKRKEAGSNYDNLGAKATGSIALGEKTSTANTATNSTAIGLNTTVSGKNTLAIGANINAKVNDSVILGDSSTAEGSQAAETVANKTIDGHTYNFAGSAEGGRLFSVGAKGKERQIKNVAAGHIEENSTDGVNGSQLYAVMKRVEKGWKLTTAKVDGATGAKVTGATSQKIAMDDTVTIKAGNNIELTQSGKDISVATSLTPTFTSVTTGNTVLNNDGLKIKNGPNVTSSGINAGNQKITNVKAGDVSESSTDAINGSQLHEVKTTADKNRTEVTSSDGSISVTDTSKDTAKHTYDIKVNNQGIVENAQVPVVYTKKDGTKVYLQANGKFNTQKDGKGEEIAKSDVIVSVNNPADSTTDGNTIFNNIGSAIKSQEGKTYLDKLNAANASTATQNAAVNVSDLNQTTTALTTKLTEKGLDFGAQSGSVIHKKLGEQLDIIGKGEKADTDYDATNIKTITENNKVVIALAKEIAVNKVIAGKDGKDGINGTVGAKGKDGSAVVLNGEDGSIGLNGKDGANGLSIKGEKGEVGVNGKDGETRLVYVEKTTPEKTHKIATTDDGLKFAGDDGKDTTKVIAKKLNEQLDFVGGADKDSLTENNIGINNKEGKLHVQLAKDVNLTTAGSLKFGDNLTLNKDGLSITGGPSVNKTGINAGNQKITNVKAGDVSASSTDAINGSQLHEVKTTADKNRTTVQSSDKTILVTDNGKEGKHEYDIKVNNQGIVENAQVPVVYTKKDGTKVYLQANGKFNTQKDGNGEVVKNEDVIVSINNPAGSTKDGNTLLNNIGSAIKSQTGNSYLDKLQAANASTATQHAAVNVSDLNQTATALTTKLTDKGLRFNANSGGEKTNKLGSLVTVKGEGAKDDSAYTGQNVKTIITQNDKGETTIDVKLDKDFTTETLAVTGKSGKDGKDALVTVGQKDEKGESSRSNTAGVDGKVAVNGKDGSSVVINGKDGSIGLNGKDGANGLTLKGDKGAVGVDGTDGANGKEGMTRLVYQDANKTKHTVATTADGLKFAADDKTEIAKKLNEKLEILGGAKKEDLTENNIGVNNQAGKLKVQLAKNLDLTTSGSIKFGDDTVTLNHNGLTLKDGPSITPTGINAGDKVISNVANGKVSADSKEAINGSQLHEVKTAADKNRTTVQSSDKSIYVTDKGKEGKHEYDIKVNNQSVVENAQVPVVYTKKDGTKVYLQANGKFNTQKDGKGETVKNEDVIVSINNPADSTKDGNTLLNNIGSAIKSQTGNSYLDKLQAANASTTTQHAAVNVYDLKQTADALAAKGLKFAGQSGSVIHKNLGEQLDIVGTGTKADSEYDSSNIKTMTTKDGKLQIGLDKDLKTETLEITGAPGKDGKNGKDAKLVVGQKGADGKNGVDGIIGVNGKDGSSVVINGKDGSIGLTGAKGKDGKDGASTNLAVQTGTTTVSERDGGKAVTRLAYSDKDKDGKTITREIATLDDGLKFTGDDGNTVNHTLGSNLHITGGAKDATKADNIRIVKDGKDGLKVKLANNITLDQNGSLNIGGTTIKDGDITIGGTTFKKGVVTNLTHHIDAPVNNMVDSKVVNITDEKKKEAATVGDVLNAGWNLQANGKAVDAVTHGDTVNLAAGDDTVSIKPTSNGKVNTLNFTVNAGAVVKQVTGKVGTNEKTAKAEVKKSGIATVEDVVNTVNQIGWKTTTTDGKTLTVNAGDSINYVNGNGTTANVVKTEKDGVENINVTYDVKSADTNTLTATKEGVKVNTGSLVQAVEKGKINAKSGDEKKVATVKNVADAINNAGWLVNTGKAADDKAFKTKEGESRKVSAGDTVNFQAGHNIEVKREGDNIVYATSENLNATTIAVTGKAGKDGKDGKDAEVLVGQNGKDGRDGVDGRVGVNGKDGSAVVINGKDGSIGLNGKDGKNGVSIKGQDGKVGVDGKDGETRLVYVEKHHPAKTHKLATTDDGLKFTGNNEVVNHNKLSSTVVIKGEGVDKETSKSFKSAKGNINVKANGQETLEVQLAKDVNLTKEGSLTVGNTRVSNHGVEIKNGPSITEKGIDAGNKRINNVATGVKDSDAVNVAQLRNETTNINNKVRKLDRNLRAGIASAMATGGLYHATTPGKTMVSVGLGTFKGEVAAAVGYSKLSDNGKRAIKFSVNTNSRGDTGAATSMGFQW